MKRIEEVSNEELAWLTIVALNGGSDSAMKCARDCRKEAYKRGDKDLIAYIEYLWDAI